MSRTIDERIVEMQFDNKQFEKNVQTSMNTLDKLKQSLQLDDAAKGFDKLNDAAKNIDLSGISEGVEALQRRFSTLGIVGMQVIQNLTNSAMNFASKIASFTIGGIVTGGYNRASNIEKAKFQLEGLKVAWDEIEADINYGVKDTAYGLDAAAIAASQLVASGVQFGETFGTTGNSPMAKALRGISGVAAMTNSTYEDISRIFTTVAGNGKLMGDQLLQLGGRGLNAAAELGKALGKSETEIREMVSKGKIDFETFANAMDDAFGQHAKDANRTFTGVISNVKAALARIGQDFYTPILKTDSEVVKMFQIIKDQINEVHKLTKPVAENMANFVVNIAKGLGETIKNLDIQNGFKGFLNILESIWNLLSGLGEALRLFGIAFNRIFPPMAAERFVEITEAIKAFTYELSAMWDGALGDDLIDTFHGLLSVVDILAQTLLSLARLVLPPLGNAFGFVAESVLMVTGTVGDWLHELDIFLKKHDVFNRAVLKLQEIFGGGFGKIKEAIQGALDAIRTFRNERLSAPDFSAFSDFTNRLKERLSPLEKLAEVIKAVFHKIGDAFLSLVPILSKVGTIIGNTIDSFSDAILKALNGGGFNALTDLVNGGILAAIGAGIMRFIHNFTELQRVTASVFGTVSSGVEGGFLDSVRSAFVKTTTDVRLSLRGLQAELKANTLLKIAGALAILAGSLVAIASVDSEKLSSSLMAVTVLLGELAAVMTYFSKSKIFEMFDARSLSKSSTAMIKMGIAINILAMALKSIGQLDLATIVKGLTGIAALMAEMIAFMYAFGKLQLDTLNPRAVNNFSRSMVVMGLALIEFGAALRIIGTMSLEDLAKGLISVALGLTMMVTALNLIDANRVLGKSAAVLVLANAMLVLSAALKIMATMSLEDIGRALLVLAGSLAAFVLALDLINANHVLAKATSVLVLADAMVILGAALKIMATMSLEDIGRSLLAMGASLAAFVIALNLIDSSHIIAKAGAILIMANALIPLAAVLKLLGTMSIGEVITSLIALAGAFTVFGVAATLLSGAIPAMLGLSAALALLGVAVAACGVGISALAIGLTALAAAGTAAAAAAVASLEIIIVGLLNVIARSGAAIADAVKTLIVAVVTAIVDSTTTIVEGFMKLIDECLKSLAVHTPSIVDNLMTFLIGLIHGIAVRMPELLDAAFELIGNFIQGIIDHLKNIDTKVLVEAVSAIGLLTAILWALGALQGLIGGAMAGLFGLGLCLAELGAILAALGVIAQIPWIKWFINEGGELLEAIGRSIGRFVGGIAGGIMQGVTSSFPKMGEDLSLFMTNLQPFIDGAKNINEQTLAGVNSLADTILVLTAANVLDGLTSWFTGGASLARFGEELAEFGPYFKQYSDAVKDINPDVVNASANAAESLAELAMHLPREGGLADILFGSANLQQFGEELAAFGASMKGYSEAVQGLNVADVEASANAAQMMADLTEKLPSAGGLAQAILGAKSLSDFGKEIEEFGPHLAEYSDSIKGVSGENVEASANAAMCLAELAENLPESGGFAQLIFGQKSLSQFGEEIAKFGPHIAAYSEAIGNVSASNVVASANAAKSLAELAKNLPDTGGLAQIVFGEKSLARLGEELAEFGPHLAKYSESIEHISGSNIVSSANAAKVLAEFVDGMPREGGLVGLGQELLFGSKSLVRLGEELAEFAPYLKSYATTISEGGFNESAVVASANAAKSLAEFASNLPTDEGKDSLFGFIFGQQQSLSKFGEELEKFAPHLVAFSSTLTKDGNGFSASTVENAANAAKCLTEFANNLPMEGGWAENIIGKSVSLSKFGEELEKFAPHLAAYAKAVADIKPDAVEGSANAAKTMAELMTILPREGGDLNNFLDAFLGSRISMKDFGEQIAEFGKAMWLYAYRVQDINAEAVIGSANAAKTLAELGQLLPRSGDKENLFSWLYGTQISYEEFGKQITEFAKALVSYSKEVAQIEDKDGMVDKSISIAKALIELANALPQIGGLFGMFTGEQDLGKFGESLTKFGAGINGYASQVQNIDTEQLGLVITEIRRLMDAVQNANLIDMAGFVEFANQLAIVGNRGISEFIKAFENSYEQINYAITCLITNLFVAIQAHEQEVLNAGKQLGKSAGQGILDGFTEMGPFISQAAVTISSEFVNNLKAALPYSTFKEIGAQNVIQAMIDGINSKKEFLYAIVRNICLNVISVIKNNLAIIFQVGAYAIEQLANGMLSMENYLLIITNNICVDAADTAYDVLDEAFFYLGKLTIWGLIRGMESMEDMLFNYMRNLAQVMMGGMAEGLGIESPSKEFYALGVFTVEGLINGIVHMTDQAVTAVDDLADAVLSPMKDAIDKIADSVNEDIDIDPVITPVIDLTQVETGAAEINKMLNKGIDLTASYNKAVTATSNNKNQLQDVQQTKSEPQTTTINQNFTQNNYSPKALSRKEIYRQTRNQFSAMRGAVSGV